MSSFHSNFWQSTGFLELKRCMKTSEEFIKEISSVMAERAELESNYHKNLFKLALKASKIASKSTGTLQTAWGDVVASMTSESEYHKSLAETLSAQLSKRMKAHGEEMYRKRKEGEAIVDRAHKTLTDRRTKEQASRVAAIMRAREVEQLTTTLEDPNKTDKETLKLGKILRKSEDLANRTEKEYRRDCIEAENLRVEWEQSMYTFCRQMESVHQSQTDFCKDVFSQFNAIVSRQVPALQEIVDKLFRSVEAIDSANDSAFLASMKGTGPNTAEHVLYSCFAEDLQSAMNSDRRSHALEERCAFFFREAIKSEKFRQGLQASGAISCADLQEMQMAKVNATIDYFQACLYRLHTALADHKGMETPDHHLASFIDIKEVKGNQAYPVMMIPLQDGIFRDSSPETQDLPFDISHHDSESLVDRSQRRSKSFFSKKKQRGVTSTNLSVGSASGHRSSLASGDSISIDSSIDSRSIGQPVTLGRQRSVNTIGGDDDPSEFDDEAFDEETEGNSGPSLGYCRALYNFEGTDETELTISEGDVIQITVKEGIGDGWWQGLLYGKEGVFPSAYVEQT